MNFGFYVLGLILLVFLIERLIVILYLLKRVDFLMYVYLRFGILGIWFFVGLIVFFFEFEWDLIFRNRVIIFDVIGIFILIVIVVCYVKIFFLVKKEWY